MGEEAWTEDRRIMGMAGACHSQMLFSALSTGKVIFVYYFDIV